MSEAVEAATRDDRPAVYVEGDRAIYRASSVGLCDEALVALRMGVQPTMPPEWMQEKFDEGAEWEGFIVEQAVKNHGLTLVSTQDTAVVEITDVIWIRGSTDGSCTNTMRDLTPTHGIEAKKLGPALFEKWEKGIEAFWEACPYYRDQLTVYMTAMGLPFLYAVGQWDPEQKKVVKVHTRMITEPPGDIETIKAKVLEIERRASAGDLGVCDGSRSYPCPVWFLHEEKQRAGVEGEVRERLADLARGYSEAAAKEKEGKAQKDAHRGEILELLAEHGYLDLEAERVDEPEAVDGFKVTPYFRANRRLDRKAMEKDGIDVAAYETTTTSVALKVTRMEE